MSFENISSAPLATLDGAAAWANSLLLMYGFCIMAASMAGGWMPLLLKLTHRQMQFLVSFVAGLMLGVAVFHMLPHSLGETGAVDRTMQWMMGGLLGMFFLIRMFHFHQHGPVEDPPAGVHPHDHDHDHSHDHDHDHHHSHSHAGNAGHGHAAHQLSWLGAAFGLSLHTLIDGMALAASVHAETQLGDEGWLLGLGTFAAIVLHKPLDAVSIVSLMTASGWSTRSKAVVNAGFACMCPLGALLFTLGMQHFADQQHLVVGYALALSAGVFLCISLSDLLPELEFHSHDRVQLSVSLIAGVVLAWAIGFLEPEHLHDSPGGHGTHEGAGDHGHHHGHHHGHKH